MVYMLSVSHDESLKYYTVAIFVVSATWSLAPRPSPEIILRLVLLQLAVIFSALDHCL